VVRNAVKRLVEGGDVLLDDLDEFAVGFVLEQEHTFHRQIGRVDLQDEAGVDDGLVFVVHLAGDGAEIVLVGLVVGVEHRGRDDPRRRLGEEHFGECRLDCAGMALEAGELGLDRFLVGVFELADRLGTAEHLSGLRKTRHELLREQRQLDPLAAEGPLRLAAEAGHALRNIGLETDPALLAVVGDIDAGLALLLHHVGDTGVDHFGEFALIDRFACLVGDQQVIKLLAARQAAGVGDQDVIDALVHDNPPFRTFSCPLIALATRRQDPHNTDLFVAAKAVARRPDQLRFAGTIAPLRAASHGQSLLYSWALYSWATRLSCGPWHKAQKEYASHAQVIWKESGWHERTITAAPLPCLRFAVMADSAGCTGRNPWSHHAVYRSALLLWASRWRWRRLVKPPISPRRNSIRTRKAPSPTFSRCPSSAAPSRSRSRCRMVGAATTGDTSPAPSSRMKPRSARTSPRRATPTVNSSPRSRSPTSRA